MLGKAEETDGQQAAETGRGCHEVTVGEVLTGQITHNQQIDATEVTGLQS